MIFYCDYEALERPRNEFKQGLIPSYLDDMTEEKVMVPLVFCACTRKGKIMHNQDYNTNKKPISFFQFCDQIIKFTKQEKHVCYFHNLYYDFNIILPELMANGYTQYIMTSENIKYKEVEKLDEHVIDKKKLFYVLGENLKKAVGVDILYKGVTFQLRDTYKIISSAQNSILKSFGFEEKPEIDFDNMNINDKWAIADLRVRCQYDVTSLAKSIELFKQSLYEKYGATGYTASSIALRAVKVYLGDNFFEYYPSIAGEEYEEISRMCYSGGITQHSHHLKAGTIHRNISYVDINSSYPNTMRDKIPYGYPTQVNKIIDNEYGEYIVYVDFKIRGDYIPGIRCNSAMRISEKYGLQSETYPKRDEFPLEWKGYLALTSYDILILRRFYDATIVVINGYVYKSNYALKAFIEGLYKMKKQFKEENDKVMEKAVKLILNSLYGKFAQDLSGENEFITEDGKIKLNCTDLKKIYCPLSNCIVSHARYNLMCQINHDPLNFIYCDTDSMMVFDRSKLNQETLGNELGQWKLEYGGKNITRLKILGKKNYMLEVDGETHLTCVGLSQKRPMYDPVVYEETGELAHKKITFDNFRYGEEFIIQKMVKVYGGLAMRYTTFTIKERKLMYNG